jgi:PAS domain S-box-containing protein
MLFDSQQDLIIALGVSLVGAILLALLGFYLFMRTSAALRQANDELETAGTHVDRTERRLMNILNAIPVALVETDAQGRFVFANRAAHQLLGRKDAELIGLRFHSATWGITYPDGRVIPPELLPAARALRGQTVKGFQHLMINPGTRKKMLVSVTAMPIMNGVGEVIGSSAAIVETEGLSTPHTAREDDDIARRYFDLAGVMLLALDAEGRVRDLNNAGAAVLGLPAAEVVGQDWIERFVPEEEREGARRFLKRVIDGKAEMPDGESWIIRGDGKRRLIAWKGTVARDAQDQFIATLSTGRDITDERVAGYQDQEFVQTLEGKLAAATASLQASEDARRKTDQLLAQAQRLETAGRLSGGAAQDFDRLLAVVGGALETLLAQADNPERVRRLGEAALAANRRGEHLSRQLLALTQPRAEDLHTADLATLLRSLEPALSRAAGRAPLALNLAVEVGDVRIDTDQFEAALVNLVSNAADAVAGGGAITVSADRVDTTEGQVAGLAAGSWTRVFVMDTGVGMNAETAARAPEVFFTTKSPAQHAGLGLSQVYGFARHAGGVARIETDPGRGTTVSIYLPLAPQ